jgi:hypothetical protein
VPVLLPKGVACYAIAATIGKKPREVGQEQSFVPLKIEGPAPRGASDLSKG